MATDLIDRAQAGDGQAFRQLVEPYRRELQVHCYRILGSAQDAEDAVQETLLAAWRGLGGFEQRSSLRTWLYRIATTRSLNALRSASRRPAMEWSTGTSTRPSPPGSARCPGSNRTRTCCWPSCPTTLPARRRATRRGRRSRWRSSPRCRSCRRGSAPP